MTERLRARLRPMIVSEILDEAVELYKSNAGLFIGISAFLYAPALFEPSATIPRTDLLKTGRAEILGLMAMLVWYVLLAGPTITGALTFGISEKYLGRSAGIWTCFDAILKPKILPRLIVVNAISLAAVFACLMVSVSLLGAGIGLAFMEQHTDPLGIFIICVSVVSFVLPAYVMSKFALALPGVVLEHLGSWQAIKRSFALSANRAFRIFTALLTVFFVVAVFQAILSSPGAYMVAMQIAQKGKPDTLVILINNFIKASASAVIMPVSSVVVFLLYVDSRIRDEGYDLTIMADEIDRLNPKHHKTEEKPD